MLPQRQIRADLRSLNKVSKRLYRFVNKKVAHRNPAGAIRRLPKIQEIDDALAVFDALLRKYDLLLTALGADKYFPGRAPAGWDASLKTT